MILAVAAELLELIWVAPLAVLIVSVSFSLCLLGATRAGERRRAGERTGAAVYGLLAALAGLAFTGTVVLGVGVIVAG